MSPNIANQYSIMNQQAQLGYNHFLYTPSQFDNNLVSFYPGLIPALISDSDLFCIKKSDNSYSDYNFITSCNPSSLSICINSRIRNLSNNQNNWKLLVLMSSKFQPDIFQIFNYSINFTHVYSGPNKFDYTLQVTYSDSENQSIQIIFDNNLATTTQIS